MKKKNRRFFYCANILLPLLLGGVLYVMIKPSAVFLQAFYGDGGIQPAPVALPNTVFGAFLQYYICDMLWAYSFAGAVSWIVGQRFFENIMSASVCTVFFLAVELCQKYGIMTGTFDVWDVVSETVAALIALLVININVRRNKHEEQVGKRHQRTARSASFHRHGDGERIL